MYCDFTFKILVYLAFGREDLVKLCDILLTKTKTRLSKAGTWYIRVHIYPKTFQLCCYLNRKTQLSHLHLIIILFFNLKESGSEIEALDYCR